MMEYVLAVEGLSSLDNIEKLPENVVRAARNAINRVTDKARTQASRDIREQVNLSASYLAQRLSVRKRAVGRNLEAMIQGSDQPVSLARFATSRNPSAARKAGGVKVQVSPGSTKFMERAFLMQLRNGNLGLALRLKDGEQLRNKRLVRKIGAGLYLLYGPSVDQIFRGVAEDNIPDIAADLEREFLRLMDL